MGARRFRALALHLPPDAALFRIMSAERAQQPPGDPPPVPPSPAPRARVFNLEAARRFSAKYGGRIQIGS